MKLKLLILALIAVCAITDAQTDSARVWASGWNACFTQINQAVSPDADAMILAFSAQQKKRDVSYQYFSASATPDTISAWINRGYIILYFGTRSATTNKIPIRGMRPQ